MKMKLKYTSLDIVALAGIAVLSGVIFVIASNYLYPFLTGLIPAYPIMILLWPFMYGFWALGGTAAGYLIRKPGSAFSGEFLGALIEMILGSYFAITTLVYGFIAGFASEVVFAMWRYKKYDYLSMALAGFLPGLAVILPGWIFLPQLISGVFAYAGYLGILIYILIHAISGAIIAGILTTYFINRIAETGIFDLLEIGKQRSLR
jgi:energy-coupling factor transport system substrate-specific component